MSDIAMGNRFSMCGGSDVKVIDVAADVGRNMAVTWGNIRQSASFQLFCIFTTVNCTCKCSEKQLIT
jgi:hypothetical protein